MENFNRLSGKMLYGLKKGQCHEIFQTFLFDKKTSPGPQMHKQKRFCKIFRFVKIFAKICKKMWVRVVIDYSKFRRRKKITIKVTKNVIWYFWKFKMATRTCAEIVVDYVSKMSAWSFTIVGHNGSKVR